MSERRAPAALLAGLVATLIGGDGCRRHDPPPVLLLGDAGGTMVFPPREEGWTDRLPIPSSANNASLTSASVQITSPSIDDKGHFEFEGQSLRMYFSEALPADAAHAPKVSITPAVKGKTVWSDGGYSLDFRADAPFDPETEYTLDLPEVTAASGRKLAAFHATFRAKLVVEVAGKTIHYVPERGRARAIMVRPSGESSLGGSQEITVVYDQPIGLGLANRLVELTNDKKERIAAVIGHPAANAFEGQKVDVRYFVTARPLRPLAPGETLHVKANAEKADDDGPAASYTIAANPKLESISCVMNDDACQVNGRSVRGAMSSMLSLRYNNPVGIGYGDGNKYVQITPKPKNLYVRGWNDLTISGSFAPSTTYTIRVAGMRDGFGSAIPAETLTFETRPLPSSATMSEGVTLLDESAVKAFSVTTRNVAEGELALWALPSGDAPAFTRAIEDARSGKAPSGDPVVVSWKPPSRRDELVDTALDLASKLERGRAYVAQVRIGKSAFGAEPPKYGEGSPAHDPTTAVLYATGPNALGAHVHGAGGKSLVSVFRLGSGEPVAGATVSIGDLRATTDALGTVLLPGSGDAVTVTAADASIMVPLTYAAGSVPATSLFPDLTLGESGADAVGMILTDRGVYRPGSSMHVKGFLRRVAEAGVKPAPNEKVRLRVTDPTGADVLDEAMTTSERGSITKDVAFEKAGHTGRFQVRLELDDGKHTAVATEGIRVADFEAPKFKVDVERGAEGAADKLAARVVGKYLFGAPMGGGKVTWTLKKTPLPINGGAMADAGLSFDHEWSYWEDRPSRDAERPLTGEGVLAEDGTLAIDTATGPLGSGPTELLLEADVTDASSRHVAGQLRGTRDPFPRHAGLRLSERFAEAGHPLRIDLGVVDGAGKPVAGVKVGARLERRTWTRTTEKAQSGALLEKWKAVGKPVNTCELTSATTPVSCELPIDAGGDYDVVTRIDGRDDASASFWAWGRWSPSEPSAVPSAGKKLPLVLDKKAYKSGETAKLLVQSPYKRATAILTIEQGGLLRHEPKAVLGRSVTFDVPVTAANAPWLNATVTLLPIGEAEADYRVGAVRVPVGSEDAKLEVSVASAKKEYRTREEAEITVEVKKNGAPVKNADVTLAVVDEGILRLTSFHAKDPVTAIRPGKGLDFRAFDTRALMMRRREKAHVAGGGDSEGEDALDTRKDFVETAAWLPNLTTDDKGRITAKVKLPDNLTEFRMMAVVLDDVGGGGKAESSFLVSKPLLLEPVMPRFATRGDAFEAAAMVHNNTDAAAPAKVTIGKETRDVTIAPHGHARVAVPMTADARGTRKMRFALAADGKTVDEVEIPLRVDEAGIAEHPQVSGVFGDRKEIQLEIPGDAVFDDDAALSIKTGSALYPELGQRLSYLLDYPHGCVEQTTSSTIPLLAARTILPWSGTTTLDDAELKKRIEAGVKRLASMQTSGGGLAYWPGGSEPNVFGTAYAMRALVRAKEIGVEQPKLIEGATTFLGERLEAETDPDLTVAIADVLAQAGTLQESAADKLYDTRTKLGSFGLGSLATALASLPKQEDRVRTVLDLLEASFDDAGEPKAGHGKHDWHYWGSADRDRAQAVIALSRLRKTSHLLPVLAARLSRGVERWTTQSTAWSLLALSDFIGGRSPDGGVDVSVKLEGLILDTYKKLGGDNKEVRVPLKDLAGKKVTLLLAGDPQTPSAFAIDARYKRPLGAPGTHVAKRAAKGVSIYRAYSDVKGKAIDLADVKAGQIVRIAVRVELPQIESHRLGYIAVTDRLPAGFDAINPDLDTNASVPDLAKEHPFYDGLTSYASSPSHVDLREDRVQLYFDHTYYPVLYATYLARATTPGTFALPPANGELMYEPGSDGWSDAASVTIR